MPHRRHLLLTLPGLLAAGAAPALADEPLLWVCGDVPPFLSRGTDGPHGYAFELYQRVSRQAGLAGDVRFLPWARAMRMLLGREAHGSLVVGRTPDREARLHWLFPVGSFRFAVFTRADEAAAPADMAALHRKRVGWLRAAAGRELLTEAGIMHVVEGKDYQELLALLQRGVVDAVVGPAPVLRTLATGSLRSTLLDRGLQLYTVAGPAMSADAQRRLTTAYQQLADGGVVAQLKKAHPEAFADG